MLFFPTFVKTIHMRKLFLCFFLVGVATGTFAQEDSISDDWMDEAVMVEEDPLVRNTFNATRIINAHSVETLPKGVLEFRIEHRFGDIAGDNGGAQNFFGFDNAADIRFAFEYGITDKLMIGLGRNKGTGDPYRSLVDGFVKYRILHQQKTGMPVSMTVLGVATTTYMKRSDDITQISYFPKWQHRMAYAAQLNIARKFGNWLSLAIMPTYVHRNYVADTYIGDELSTDVNGLFSIGGAAKFRISPTKAIIVEYFQNIHGSDIRKGYKNSLGIAYEWDTFGHNFTINLTNARGFTEVQYIPYTKEDWLKGQFRFGFSISRKFEKG